MKQCRYFELQEGRAHCAYWDMALFGDEDLRCYPGGWECYEGPGGCIFEGRWMSLTDYADYCQSKGEREIPEDYEFQEFPLESEGLPGRLPLAKRHRLERMTGEFHYLKVSPEYPSQLKMAALVRLQYDFETMPSGFHPPQGSQWVASLWIVDGPCQVDLAWVLKENRLDFVEGHCSHGDLCPKVEELKQAILESVAFAQLREDLIEKLFQRTVVDLDPVQPLSSPQTVPPGEEDRDHWACERL